MRARTGARRRLATRGRLQQGTPRVAFSRRELALTSCLPSAQTYSGTTSPTHGKRRPRVL